jgi:hypothetical protein
MTAGDMAKRAADEVEYRVRTAIALYKGGHDYQDEIDNGRAAAEQIVREATETAPVRATAAREALADMPTHVDENGVRYGRLGERTADYLIETLGALTDVALTPTESVESRTLTLARHCWSVGHWADSRGGYTWVCTCGIHDKGTQAENPGRYTRYPTGDAAALAAARHIVAVQDSENPA